MAGASSEAERLRRCRMAFEVSNRDGIPMSAALARAAEERWREADKRLAARCGTRAPAAAGDEAHGATPPRWMMAE